MRPQELQDIAAAHVGFMPDKEGNKKLTVSNEKVTLAPHLASQFDQLVGKLKEANPKAPKPTVTKLSNRGAILVKAKDLVEVLSACNKAGIELDDPQ